MSIFADEPKKVESSPIPTPAEIRKSTSRGLEYLKSRQNEQGAFGDYTEQPALCALPLIAFARDTSGDYQNQKGRFLRKGYGWLRSSAQADGGIYNPKKGLENYNTALSLVCLVLANDPDDLPLLQSGRAFLLSQQARGMKKPETDGGFGWVKEGLSKRKPHPDLDNTLVAVEALRATQNLPGAIEPDWQAVIGFASRCQNFSEFNDAGWVSGTEADKGGFVYFPGASNAGFHETPDGKKTLHSSGSMTYAGLLVLLHSGVKKDDPRLLAAIHWLSQHYTVEENPGQGQQGYFYYLYLMAKGLQEAEKAGIKPDKVPENWRAEIARKLISRQRQNGSWENDEGVWMERNPVLATSYAILAFEAVK